MMFKRISLIATLLFFLLGTTAFAYSNPQASSPNDEKHITQSHTVNKDSKSTTAKTVTASQFTNSPITAETKKAEPTLMNYVVPAAVGLFIFIIFGGYWFVFRKKFITR